MTRSHPAGRPVVFCCVAAFMDFRGSMGKSMCQFDVQFFFQVDTMPAVTTSREFVSINLRACPPVKALMECAAGDAQLGEGSQIESDWDFAAQPNPDYEVDRQINGVRDETASQTRCG